MGLGLAANTRKSRVGIDPRNTQWANDTARFGHKHMMSMGWKPGRGLGHSTEGRTSHVHVKLKTDNRGLGSEAESKDQPHGLDVFQKILGRLNGGEVEAKVDRQVAESKRQRGMYLMFEPGGYLEGTIGKKELKSSNEYETFEPANKKNKDTASQKSSKSSKKKKKDHKSRAENSKVGKLPRESSKERRSRRKLEKQHRRTGDTSETTQSNVETLPIDAGNDSEPSQIPSQHQQRRGIRATRSRYIAMKQRATSDSQSLKEILML